MTITEQFLNTYKELEQTIAAAEDLSKVEWCVFQGALPAGEAPVFFLENHMADSARQAKLRMCRLIRNYIQHNPDAEGFVIVSKPMVLFLNDLVSDISRVRLSAKDVMKRITLPTDTTTIAEAAEMLLKKKVPFLPVVDSDKVFLGVVSEHNIYEWFASGTTRKTLLKKYPLEDKSVAYLFVNPQTPASTIDASMMSIVVDDKKKVKGVIFPLV